MTQPPNYDTHGSGFGHYMRSYIKYIPSKLAFIVVMMKQSLSVQTKYERKCSRNMGKNGQNLKLSHRNTKKKTILVALFFILLLRVLLLIAHWFEIYCFNFLSYRPRLLTVMNIRAGGNRVWHLNCVVTPHMKYQTDRWLQVLLLKR